MPDTLIFDPTPCGFPRPRVPLLPTGLDGIALRSARPWAPAAHFRHFARGRYALREAYRPAEENRTALRLSRWLTRHADHTHITRHRRDNYQRWAAATRNLPHARPLYPKLPAGCIPYMFPLLIDRPEPDFYLLKHLGLPIWRWDSLVASYYPIANNYRLRLLHLPCHPSLDNTALDWMIAAVQKVGPGGTAIQPSCSAVIRLESRPDHHPPHRHRPHDLATPPRPRVLPSLRR